MRQEVIIIPSSRSMMSTGRNRSTSSCKTKLNKDRTSSTNTSHTREEWVEIIGDVVVEGELTVRGNLTVDGTLTLGNINGR